MINHLTGEILWPGLILEHCGFLEEVCLAGCRSIRTALTVLVSFTLFV